MTERATHRKSLDCPTEQGSAMVVTLLVMAVLTGLGAIVFNVGLANLQNTGRDRLAGGALGASEGGVAEALQFIRTNGTSTLTCDDPPITGTDCTKDWGKDNRPTGGSDNRHTVSLPNGRQYKVWIQRFQKFNPPAVKQGIFLIHSEGTAGTGRGKRNVRVRVIVKPLEFPIGIYADDMTNGGSADIKHESVFTKSCITQRDRLLLAEGPDPYYNMPSSAHAGEYITTSQSTCAANDRNNIHSQPQSTEPGECNPTYKNDQDFHGGPLTDAEGAPCVGTPLQYDGYPQTSKFSVADLEAFGYKDPRGLSLAEYAQLKTKAQEQNNFYTSASFTTPDEDNAVMYFDLRGVTVGDKTVSIQTGSGPGQLGDNWTTLTCGSKSLVIVVEGGNLKITSNSSIVGAIFVPDGTYSGAGEIKIIGTLFAKEIKPFGGNAKFTLKGDSPNDNCFFDNFPGGLLSVNVDKFREIDR